MLIYTFLIVYIAAMTILAAVLIGYELFTRWSNQKLLERFFTVTTAALKDSEELKRTERASQFFSTLNGVAFPLSAYTATFQREEMNKIMLALRGLPKKILKRNRRQKK